ncbi:hypothetical protein JW824_01690 [bacterium]|nr:hypothetical protein [bacterium]
MKKAYWGFMILSIACMIGCASQLAVRQMMVDPPTVNVGSQAKIMVVFTGPKNAVSTVIATVRENPEMYFALNDEGQDGDEEAGDNVWTYTVSVPWDAPADTYHLDIRARDQEGNEIITGGYEQQETGRSGTVEVIVN